MTATDTTQLTTHEQRVLDSIFKYIEHHHTFPSYRELMATLSLKSTNSIRHHIVALRHKGYLAQDRGKIKLSDSYEVVVRRRAVCQVSEGGDDDE